MPVNLNILSTSTSVNRSPENLQRRNEYSAVVLMHVKVRLKQLIMLIFRLVI